MSKASEADIQQFMQDVQNQGTAQAEAQTQTTDETGENVTIEDRTRATSTDSDAIERETQLPSEVPEDLSGLSREELIERLTAKNQAADDEALQQAADDAAAESDADKEGSEEEAAEVTLESISTAEGALSDNEFAFFSGEFDESGELSEESIAALEKRGYPKQYVQQYIEGVKAIVAQRDNTLFDIAGGRDNYVEMLQWASEGLSQKEIEVFDAAVKGADFDAAQEAVKGLYARYGEANGQEPKTTSTTVANNGTRTGGYQSQAELQKDLSNPRYFVDVDFQNAVAAKLAKTDPNVI